MLRKQQKRKPTTVKVGATLKRKKSSIRNTKSAGKTSTNNSNNTKMPKRDPLVQKQLKNTSKSKKTLSAKVKSILEKASMCPICHSSIKDACHAFVTSTFGVDATAFTCPTCRYPVRVRKNELDDSDEPYVVCIDEMNSDEDDELAETGAVRPVPQPQPSRRDFRKYDAVEVGDSGTQCSPHPRTRYHTPRTRHHTLTTRYHTLTRYHTTKTRYHTLTSRYHAPTTRHHTPTT